MKGSQLKVIKRIIAKIYFLSKSDFLRLALNNLSSKLLIDRKNEIEYDCANNLYWLKRGRKYLLSIENPYFDFHWKNFEQRVLNICCWRYIPKEGDVIINVGAGIGEEVNFFREKIEENGQLHNIEASPANYKKLELLCQKNNYFNCINHNCAISDSNGEMWIEETENYVGNKTNEEGIGIKVRCFSLDQFIVDNNLSKIDYLKVNIEGAEFQMIDGMTNCLKISQNIAISCHDFLSEGNDSTIKNKISNYLIANDFQVFYRNSGNEVLDSWLYGKKCKGQNSE